MVVLYMQRLGRRVRTMKINCFALARYAELHEGLLSAQGFGLNRFYWPTFPALTPPIFLVLGVDEDSEDAGEWKFRLRQLDADGKALSRNEGTLTTSAEKPGLHLLGLQLGFPVPGDYVLVLDVAPPGTEAWAKAASKSFKAGLPPGKESFV